MSSATTKTCWRPGCSKSTEAKPNKCPICKMAVYCGPKCRKEHRKQHKKECAEIGGREDIKLSKRLQELELGNEGRWRIAPEHERLTPEERADLLAAWAASMPPDRLARFPPGTTPQEAMERLALRPAFVHDLKLGDWDAIDRRIVESGRPVRVRNVPPLRVGDVVEVLPGNDVCWEMVGQTGPLMEYFPEDKKWGIDLYPDPSLIMEGNLKRIEGVGSS